MTSAEFSRCFHFKVTYRGGFKVASSWSTVEYSNHRAAPTPEGYFCAEGILKASILRTFLQVWPVCLRSGGYERTDLRRLLVFIEAFLKDLIGFEFTAKWLCEKAMFPREVVEVKLNWAPSENAPCVSVGFKSLAALSLYEGLVHQDAGSFSTIPALFSQIQPLSLFYRDFQGSGNGFSPVIGTTSL